MFTSIYVHIGLLEEKNIKKNNANWLGRIWEHIRDNKKKNGREPNAKSESEIANNINSFIPLKHDDNFDLAGFSWSRNWKKKISRMQ